LVGISSSHGLVKIFVASLLDGSVKQYTLDKSLRTGASQPNGPQAIEWLPDQSGWVIKGENVFSKTQGRVVWSNDFGKEKFTRNIVLMDAILHPTKVKDETGADQPVLKKLKWSEQTNENDSADDRP